MFVVFEGIDGSGKTTLSGMVAKALRESGLSVEHVREGGRFASPITQGLREFTRDARNLKLVPEAELLLYAAREAQLLREATLPALARADVVIADRFFFTAGLLACEGRGLDPETVAPVLRAASGGIEPDLVIWVDADPHLARARRRVSKIVSPKTTSSSRKGLSGAGLQWRLRAGYRRLSEADPQRWIVLDNDEEPLDSLAEWVTALVRIARGLGPAAAARAAALRDERRPALPLRNAAEAKARLLAWVDARALREPGVAAYLLSGLAGAGIDERRLALAPRAPEVIAWGLDGLDDAVSWRLREELAATAPRQVARSLALCGEAAWPMRARLASVAPAEVAASLAGDDDPRAWLLRDAIAAVDPMAVLRSLKRLGTPRAWEMRERLLGTADAASRAASVTGLEGERAWEIRRAARGEAPVAAIESLAGLGGEEAWAWRDELLAFAPRVVVRTLDGDESDRAWRTRRAVAARCKEAIDSITGLDSPEAWSLRLEHASRWPSTVAKSLGALAHTVRGSELIASLLAAHPGDLSLWKHVAASLPPVSALVQSNRDA